MHGYELHGVVGLTKAMAVELGSQGLTVNCICPGSVKQVRVRVQLIGHARNNM